MRKLLTVLAIVMAVPAANAATAAGSLDSDSFLRQQGWKRCEDRPEFLSPDPDVKTICYYEKANSVPSCGLLSKIPGSEKPNFMELVSSDAGADYPQCMGINFMVPFVLQGKYYLAIEYESRETREDFYRAFYFIYKDGPRGYAVDKTLNSATPSIQGDIGPDIPDPSKKMDGVRFARRVSIATAFPHWRFLDLHFISNQRSSFAVLDDRESSRCYFVAEAGADPIAMSDETFVPDAKCIGIVATGQLERAGTIYYLAMFESDKTPIKLVVTSVNQNGRITPEKELSDALNRSGSFKDMQGAKRRLSGLLH
jgi:hypothetical protein